MIYIIAALILIAITHARYPDRTSFAIGTAIATLVAQFTAGFIIGATERNVYTAMERASGWDTWLTVISIVVLLFVAFYKDEW